MSTETVPVTAADVRRVTTQTLLEMRKPEDTGWHIEAAANSYGIRSAACPHRTSMDTGRGVWINYGQAYTGSDVGLAAGCGNQRMEHVGCNIQRKIALRHRVAIWETLRLDAVGLDVDKFSKATDVQGDTDVQAASDTPRVTITPIYGQVASDDRITSGARVRD